MKTRVNMCRWLRVPDTRDPVGLLRINGKDYEVKPITVAGVLVGHEVGTYEICTVPHRWRCTCLDFKHRHQRGDDGRGCKHTAALRAALASAGLIAAN